MLMSSTHARKHPSSPHHPARHRPTLSSPSSSSSSSSRVDPAAAVVYPSPSAASKPRARPPKPVKVLLSSPSSPATNPSPLSSSPSFSPPSVQRHHYYHHLQYHHQYHQHKHQHHPRPPFPRRSSPLSHIPDNQIRTYPNFSHSSLSTPPPSPSRHHHRRQFQRQHQLNNSDSDSDNKNNAIDNPTNNLMEAPQPNRQWVRHFINLRRANNNSDMAGQDWLKAQHAALRNKAIPSLLKCLLAAARVSDAFSTCAKEFQRPEFRAHFWQWCQSFIALVDFRIKFGHVRVDPSFDDTSEQHLVKFIKNARQQYIDNHLAHHKEELLLALGVKLDVSDGEDADNEDGQRPAVSPINNSLGSSKSADKLGKRGPKKKGTTTTKGTSKHTGGVDHMVGQMFDRRRRSVDYDGRVRDLDNDDNDDDDDDLYNLYPTSSKRSSWNDSKYRRHSTGKPTQQRKSQLHSGGYDVIPIVNDPSTASHAPPLSKASLIQWARHFIALRRHFAGANSNQSSRHSQHSTLQSSFYRVPQDKHRLWIWMNTEGARSSAGSLCPPCCAILKAASIGIDNAHESDRRMHMRVELWGRGYVSLVDFLLDYYRRPSDDRLLSLDLPLTGALPQNIMQFLASAAMSCRRPRHSPSALSDFDFAANALLSALDPHWGSARLTRECVSRAQRADEAARAVRKKYGDQGQMGEFKLDVDMDISTIGGSSKFNLRDDADNDDGDEMEFAPVVRNRQARRVTDHALASRPTEHTLIIDDDDEDGEDDVDIDDIQPINHVNRYTNVGNNPLPIPLHDKPISKVHNQHYHPKRSPHKPPKKQCEKMVSSMIKGMVAELTGGRSRTVDERQAEAWVEQVGVEALNQFAKRWNRSFGVD